MRRFVMGWRDEARGDRAVAVALRGSTLIIGTGRRKTARRSVETKECFYQAAA
jgi:hypothetical protein